MWDDLNSTFESEAVGFNLFRGQCRGKWQISASTTVLQGAGNCSEFSAVSGLSSLQNIITENDLEPGNFALQLLADYLGFPGKTFDMLPMWVAVVNAMIWTRINALNGIGLERFGERYPALAYPTTDTITSSILILQRKWLLFLVLATQPILLIVASFATLFLYSTPVSNNFGLTALMAGLLDESRELLRGAAFSGQLERPVTVKIVTRRSSRTESNVIGIIKYVLDGKGKNSRIKRGRYYK
jgi:hypothetical protein